MNRHCLTDTRAGHHRPRLCPLSTSAGLSDEAQQDFEASSEPSAGALRRPVSAWLGRPHAPSFRLAWHQPAAR